eukprot:891877-Pleurochrysis_carterae.AAC.2
MLPMLPACASSASWGVRAFAVRSSALPTRPGKFERVPANIENAATTRQDAMGTRKMQLKKPNSKRMFANVLWLMKSACADSKVRKRVNKDWLPE